MAGASHSRIGVFGGTFDPVHNTHCDIARAAAKEARLDRVFFVVAAHPPHKTDGVYAAPEQRLAMVQAATADLPRMEASALELRRDVLRDEADADVVRDVVRGHGVDGRGREFASPFDGR